MGNAGHDIPHLNIRSFEISDMSSEFRYEFCLGDGNTHDLVIWNGIHEILVSDDLYQLTVVDLRYHHFVKIADDLSQVPWERPDVTQMYM